MANVCAKCARTELVALSVRVCGMGTVFFSLSVVTSARDGRRSISDSTMIDYMFGPGYMFWANLAYLFSFSERRLQRKVRSF